MGASAGQRLVALDSTGTEGGNGRRVGGRAAAVRRGRRGRGVAVGAAMQATVT